LFQELGTREITRRIQVMEPAHGVGKPRVSGAMPAAAAPAVAGVALGAKKRIESCLAFLILHSSFFILHFLRSPLTLKSNAQPDVSTNEERRIKNEE
jgi:hypothetical protein